MSLCLYIYVIHFTYTYKDKKDRHNPTWTANTQEGYQKYVFVLFGIFL